MKHLLHLSDFHFTGDGENIGNRILNGLIDFLAENDIKIDYLIHTGDFLDGRSIVECCGKAIVDSYPDYFKTGFSFDTFVQNIKQAECEKQGIIEAYNSRLLQLYRERFSKVSETFRDLQTRLNVQRNNVIICCGNHDKVRLISNEEENECSCTCGKYTRSTNDSFAFEPFAKFCEGLTLNYDYNTFFKRTEDFNFLILNSNWAVPSCVAQNKGHYSCVNCSQIASILDEYASSEEGKPNVAVAHQPIDDFCECFKFRYNNNHPLSKRIDSNTQMFLCGDKHTARDSIRGITKDYLCGSPLGSKEIIYNLIEYNDETIVFNCKHLVWNNDTWTMVPVDELLDAVYSLCGKNISASVNGFLKCPKLATIEQALENIGKFKQERAKIASDLFKAVCDFRENGEAENNWEGGTIFEGLLKKIKSSEERIPFWICGKCGTGKSTFLGIEYIYLLEEFKRGKLQYLPVYYNVQKEKVEATRRKKLFSDFCKKAQKLSDNYNVPLLYILDGLDQKNFTKNTDSLENEVYKEFLINQESIHKVIPCYNEYRAPKFTDNSLPKDNTNVLAFHSVKVLSLGTNKNWFDIFINAYLDLKGTDPNLKTRIGEKVKDYRKTSINLAFLHSNYNDIERFVKGSISGWDVLQGYGESLNKYSENKLKLNNNQYLPLAAYLFSFEGMGFEVIKEKLKAKKDKDRLSYEVFSLMIKNDDIRRFLIAKHYINELVSCASRSEKNIEPESILNRFLPRDIAIMIRLAITDNNAVLQSIEKLINRLDGQALSIPYYLLGHLRIDSAEKEQSIENWKRRVTNNAGAKQRVVAKSADARSGFLKKAADRSKRITEIICASEINNHGPLFDYLHELINNKQERIYNRLYQLLYYGDLSINGEDTERVILPEKDCIHEGFDFANCFNIFISKLDYNISNNIRYHIMELDLFTLCDIVYSRLQTPSITCRGKEINSFFYNEEYDRQENRMATDVLDRTFSVVRRYLNNVGRLNPSLKTTDSIYVYFSMMKETFEECLHLMRRRTTPWDSNGLQYLTHPSRPFIDLQKLEKMSRIGWLIKEKGGFDEERRFEYTQMEPKETILEHVYEAICIALLYLPDEINKNDISVSTTIPKAQIQSDRETYNKERILIYLLIHEFGKLKTMDYTPDSDDKDLLKVEEIQKQLSILNLGAIDGFGSMKNYYRIIEEGIGESKRDINLLFAKDIIAVQREFKLALLKKQGEMIFSHRREEDFKNSTKIATNLGKDILDKVVTNNPYFQTK